MIRATIPHDGGVSWTVDSQLTDLVTAQHTLRFNIPGGEEGVRMQVHVVAVNPDNGNHIVVGTEEAGVIESFDGGTSWSRINFSERITAISALFFSHRNNMVVSTYGRGLWQIVNRSVRPPQLCLNHPRGCRSEVVDIFEEIYPYPFDDPFKVCPRWLDPPTCQILIALDGRITGFSLDPEMNVEKVTTDKSGIGAYDLADAEVRHHVVLDKDRMSLGFPDCRVCAAAHERGGAIRGLILGKTKLLGVLVEFPERLPQELFNENVPYLQLVGTSFAGGLAASLSGETVTVYGKGFCGEPKCSGITLVLEGRVAGEGIKSKPDGTFRTEFTVKECPGSYILGLFPN